MSRVPPSAGTGAPGAPVEPPVGVGWRHPHYRELLEDLPALDFIEVHSENFFGEGGAALATLLQGRAHYPVSLHGVGLALGSAAGLDAWHLAQLRRLVDRVEPVRVSDHAAFARGNVAGRALHAADLLPLPFTDEALDVLCANVQQAQDALGRPLLVENLSAYVAFAGGGWDEADFLVALARRTGCRLLVDLNNLYVNARNAQLAGDPREPLAACRAWLARVDAAVVGELHLAGHCAMDDIVIDDHGSAVCDEVWQLYRHALVQLGPVPTLIEWDTAVPPLGVLLAEADRAQRIASRVLVPEAEPTAPSAL